MKLRVSTTILIVFSAWATSSVAIAQTMICQNLRAEKWAYENNGQRDWMDEMSELVGMELNCQEKKVAYYVRYHFPQKLSKSELQPFIEFMRKRAIKVQCSAQGAVWLAGWTAYYSLQDQFTRLATFMITPNECRE